MADPDSTVAGIPEERAGRLARFASRTFTVLLLLACVAGALGVLGGRTATASASHGGYRLTLLYPRTIRPGLDALWKLRIVHPGGFHGHPVTVAITASYFTLFETQGWYPTPADTTSDGRYVYQKFSPPQHGDTLSILFDSYLQPYIAPSDLLANHAVVAVMSHGKRQAAVPYTVWVVP